MIKEKHEILEEIESALLRERIIDVCRRTQTRLQDSDVREAGGGIQTVDRVVSIIENRATFLIQSLI